MTFSPGETTDPAQAATAARAAGAAGAAVPVWQQRALARSLGDARARSMERLALFVDAARSLAVDTSSANFTVQQVVAASGQSLKSFYRHFGGKDDLLLALIEDDCEVGALFLRALVDRHRVPTERLHAYVTGIFELMAAGESGYVSVLVREHRRLAELRPADMDAALAPFLHFLAAELATAMETGAIRAGDPDRDARMVFQLVLANIHELVLGRHAPAPVARTTGRPARKATPPVVDPLGPDPTRAALIRESADYVWRFCSTGLAGTTRRCAKAGR